MKTFKKIAVVPKVSMTSMALLYREHVNHCDVCTVAENKLRPQDHRCQLGQKIFNGVWTFANPEPDDIQNVSRLMRQTGLNPIHLLRESTDVLYCGLDFPKTFRHTTDADDTTCTACWKQYIQEHLANAKEVV